MNCITTDFDGAWLIEPRVFSDVRGWFFECWNQREFAESGLDAVFVQDNHSRSRRHTVRGLHYQAPPHAQAKLVRVVAGEIYDVIVDIRHGSPTYGEWQAFILSDENRRMLYIPTGFAHGFAVLSEQAEVVYKCSDFYAPDAGRGILWNDPELDIDWPVADPVLSEQDSNHPTLADIEPCFAFRAS
jgi:dTDP-4-dehydrorhamnose 3,5-epimerase